MSDVAVVVTFGAGYVLTALFIVGATVQSLKPSLQPVRVRSNKDRR